MNMETMATGSDKTADRSRYPSVTFVRLEIAKKKVKGKEDFS